MKKLSARNQGWLVLGGGLLLGAAVGLLIFLWVSQWSGSRQASNPSQSIAVSTQTPISTRTIVWPTTNPSSSLADGNNGSPAPFAGERAPDFEFLDIHGEAVSLSDLQGKVVFLNFWATWCGPCRIEMPILQDRYERFGDQGFEILAVSFEASLEDVLDFQQELGLSFPIMIDMDEAVQDLYRIRGFPTSVVVRRDGIIHTVHFGSISNFQLDQILSEVGVGS
jgi:peroxiredoxin